MIVAAITGLLTGGLGVAIVNGLFGRVTVEAAADNQQAETIKLLQEISQSQLTMMQEQMNTMKERMDRLESDIAGRDMTIAELKAENEKLQCEVDELTKQNKAKDRKIRELSGKLHEQDKRIIALERMLEGRDDNPC